MEWKLGLPRLISFVTSPMAIKAYKIISEIDIRDSDSSRNIWKISKVIYIYFDIKLITGLLAATPPSIRLNVLTFPVESLVSKLCAGKYVGAAEVPMHISERKASRCGCFFT